MALAAIHRMTYQFTMPEAPRIILVEDEEFQRLAVAQYLALQGLAVLALADGAALREEVARAMPDVVLLDVRLPGEDGFALARWLRGLAPGIGILMLTAAGETLERVIGLESGADDYLPKPFEPRELLARLRALLRRVQAPARAAAPLGQLVLADGVLDLRSGAITGRASGPEQLSAAELGVLRLLAERAGQPVSRAELAGGDAAGPRAADLRVMRLRRRLEADATRPMLIRSIRGKGYALDMGGAGG